MPKERASIKVAGLDCIFPLIVGLIPLSANFQVTQTNSTSSLFATDTMQFSLKSMVSALFAMTAIVSVTVVASPIPDCPGCSSPGIAPEPKPHSGSTTSTSAGSSPSNDVHRSLAAAY